MLYIFVALFAVGALVGGLTGYKWNASQLVRCRADLSRLEMAGTNSGGAVQDAGEHIEKRLSDQAAEFKAKIDQITQSSVAEQEKLKASVNAAQQRIAGLKEDLGRLQGELEGQRRSADTLQGTAREAANEKVRTLEQQIKRLKSQEAGVACLSASVPSDEVTILNSRLDQ